ncbi:aminotransferase class V-fold PLP-dependent enzyme [Roseiterribacter gracilis]|uniref:Cysteine desulfurase n=1 Tax=Roseiterribacter gracilis TaxID=2812848 RepID=A0A8S8XKK9_9PROT|nr:cysteine desulfurase [Rhodospirillales bacterium TMPK1]
MQLSRRAALLGAGSIPLFDKAALAAAPTSITFPAKAEFAPMKGTYLDSGSQHPLPLGAQRSVEAYFKSKSLDASAPEFGLGAKRKSVLERFAKLINADPNEVCFAPSTTAGENLVVQALDLPAKRGRVVTDALHFFGSFFLYQELARQGVDVVMLRPNANSEITVDQYEKAITKDTRFVALSLVSTINGYEQDLKKICDIAHARGALVYADIIHAVGAVPVDVKASGVDFAACATYKWLMGEMGLGFLYARADALPKIKRPWYGYHQIAKFETHVYPFDPPGDLISDSTPSNDATGYFEMGTSANAVIAILDWSLDFLLNAGVERIMQYRQPMLDRLQGELRKRGMQPMTPLGSRTPLVAFALENARALQPKLKAANVEITLSRNRFRFSPSVFNDMNDIERALDALKAT